MLCTKDRTWLVIIILLLLSLLLLLLKHGLNKKNNGSIQHINLYELSETTASIIKYTSIQILNCLQKLINGHHQTKNRNNSWE